MQGNGSPRLAEFFQNQPESQFAPGEIIIQPWDMGESVVFVQSGFLKIFSTTKRGREVTVAYYNPNSHCGELLFGTTQQFKKYSIEALTPVVIRKALRSEFVKFLDDHPEVCHGLALCLTGLVMDLFEQIESLKSGSSYQRLASCLYYLARELGHSTSPGRVIDCRLTHRMLASLTGLTRETVTLQLKRLKEKGLIAFSNHIYQVPSLERLRVETVYQADL